MKKIVFVINYFYPDVASTSQLMTELCTKLENEFDITIIAAQPGYAGEEKQTPRATTIEYLGSLKVVRVALPMVNKNSKYSRVRYTSLYFLRALRALIKEKKVDLIYTISQPPVAGGLIGTIGKILKRAKHVYNIQDFNPEQAVAAGFTNQKALISAAKAVDKLNCQMADHVVVVGEDMAETLKKRFAYQKVPPHSVINNWTNEEEILPLPKGAPAVQRFLQKHDLQGKFLITYSGNLGLFYDLENLITIANDFKSYKDIVFLFVGEGAKKEEMQHYVKTKGLNNVKFLPYQPQNALKYSLNAADAHLVVNQKGIKGVSVPSKIYGVMAAGKPIIGVLEKGSEAQKLISASCSGIVVEPQNYAGVREAVRLMYEMEEREREAIGMFGRSYLDQHLRKETSIQKYGTLLHQLTTNH